MAKGVRVILQDPSNCRMLVHSQSSDSTDMKSPYFIPRLELEKHLSQTEKEGGGSGDLRVGGNGPK